MQISTIHAFLLKLLREYAFETGIALDVKMLEDEEDKKRKTDFFNKWYDKHFDEIQKFSTDWIVPVESTKAERDVTRDVMLNMFMDIANIREDIIYDLTDHTPDFEKAAADYI
jgi:ATP-dependent exoDNAse (exonuclease V) beta subunit